jgi:protein gp37
MNAQSKFDKSGEVISRGIEWTHIFGIGSGYTANPVRGCTHGCEWRMPDGKIVKCYAGVQRNRIDGDGAFENITFHPDVFQKIARHKGRAGIFIDSMSDLCGNGVDADWIRQVISVMNECSYHIFFVLTKNPRRLTEFEWPNNALVGISAPPTFMYGKEMNAAQQRTWFRKGADWLMEATATQKWFSLEPLAVDVSDILQDCHVDWTVIGAGSDGRKTYQPDELIFQKTLSALATNDVRVFLKGNLDRALAERHGGWREEWPKV